MIPLGALREEPGRGGFGAEGSGCGLLRSLIGSGLLGLLIILSGLLIAAAGLLCLLLITGGGLLTLLRLRVTGGVALLLVALTGVTLGCSGS